MKLRTSFFSFITIVTLSLSSLLHAAPEQHINIVMDLGGVTMTTDTNTFINHVGWLNLPRLLWNKEKIRTQMYELFNAVKPRDEQNLNVIDDRGKQFPQIMIEWMNGELAGEDALILVEDFLAENPDFFSSSRDRDLLMIVVKVMFNNEKFIETQKVYTEAYEFACSCKQRGYKLYVLSNWPKTLDLLQEKHSNFFDLCDGIVLSADAHELKPNPTMYDYFIKQTGCTPSTTILIDDQMNNITAAEKAGWQGVLCAYDQNENPDFEAVDTKLRTLVKSIAPEHPSVKPPLVTISQD